MSMVLAFRDRRWISWRWRPILEQWAALRVFINPDIFKTSAFLVSSTDGDLVSTVFFVRIPLNPYKYHEGQSYYAVTTRHSLVRQPLSIRLNKRDGGIHEEPTDINDWISHSHRDADIAVLPIDHFSGDLDMTAVDAYEIVTNREYIFEHKKSVDVYEYRHRYGTGDEVFSVGLFAGHPGEDRIYPAARFGHIALYPAEGEKVLADTGEVDPVTREPHYRPIDAFLVEISAMTGQSGSPVFLRPWVNQEDRRDTRPIDEMNFLVGMIQGFYPMEVDARLQNRKLRLKVDAGMAIVIPAELIYKMLMEDRFIKERERKLEQVRQRQQDKRLKPSPASIPPPSTSE